MSDNNVPFQVTNLIQAMSNKNEIPHIRSNYRLRLELIRQAIDKAIIDYDIEMGTIQPPRFKKGQR